MAALPGGTADSSAVTAQNTTVSMRTALLLEKMAQEAQAHSGDPLIHLLADQVRRVTTLPHFPDSAEQTWLSGVRHSMWLKNHGAFERKV